VKLPIHINDENWDGEGLDHCTVTITPRLAKRIKLFANTLKKLKAVYLEEWGSPDEFYTTDDASEDFRLDCHMLRVSDGDFCWRGFFKNLNISWETELVPMKVVDEILKVARTPRNRLPLLMGTLESEDAQQLLEQRLRGEKSKRGDQKRGKR